MKGKKKSAKVRKNQQKNTVNPTIVIDEQPTYQELHRIPNIHMLKKPVWAVPPVQKKEKNFEFAGISLPKGLFKSLFSIPTLIVLSLPLLIVFSLTSFNSDLFFVPQFLREKMVNLGTYGFMGFWGIALVVFIPWSILVCSFESWIGKKFE